MGSGLKAGDYILSSGKSHLASASHDYVISQIRESQYKTLTPMRFFHNTVTRYLIICRPLELGSPIGILISSD